MVQGVNVDLNKKFNHVVGGADCRIHCLRDMLEYKGVCLSPEMCFGLGEGLGFRYWQETKTRIPMLVIIGRSVDVESRLCETVGSEMIKHQPVDNCQAQASLIDSICLDEPIMLDVDRFYLPHLANLFGRSHFGLHALVVVAYDDKNNKFGVYDFTSPDIVWCPADALSKARSSTWQPFPPLNIWYEFLPTKNTQIDRKLILTSIENVCANLLNSKKSIGINAIRAFVQDVRLFRNYLRGGFVNAAQQDKFNGYIALQISFVARYIGEIEPTGTMFRSVYANFLNEAAQMLEDNHLKLMVDRLHEIGALWRNIADISRNEIAIIEKLACIENKLMHIVDMEQQYFIDLKSLISKRVLA